MAGLPIGVKLGLAVVGGSWLADGDANPSGAVACGRARCLLGVADNSGAEDAVLLGRLSRSSLAKGCPLTEKDKFQVGDRDAPTDTWLVLWLSRGQIDHIRCQLPTQVFSLQPMGMDCGLGRLRCRLQWISHS